MPSSSSNGSSRINPSRYSSYKLASVNNTQVKNTNHYI